MDSNSVAASIGQQFVTAWNAPVPFLAAMIPVILVIWWLVNRDFRIRLQNAESTIALYKEQLARTEGGEAIAIAAASVPAHALPKKEDGPRIFARKELTPGQIMTMFKTMTELQVKKVLKDDIGKFMKVSGAVGGVAETLYNQPMVSLHIPEGGFIFCGFATGTALETLSQGDTIAVTGQFVDLSGLGIWLNHCELVA